jgi:hypothetical protein
LSVILQKDPVVQPIEDSHVEWLSDDADIKAQKKFANRMEVGRFIFPPQEFDAPPMERMCEAMSYSPWHSIAAHRPLGNMQRARKAVYLAGASLRPSDRSPQKADRIHQEYLKIAALRSMQESLSREIAAYMSAHGLGFVEFTKRLGTSTRQTSRILKGEANVTLATLAEVAVHIAKVPKIVFDDPPPARRRKRATAKKRA